MAFSIKEGEGIKLVPSGDSNEIRVIIEKHRSWWLLASIEFLKFVGYILFAAITGLAEALPQLFL